jgi:hypothetical protein
MPRPPLALVLPFAIAQVGAMSAALAHEGTVAHIHPHGAEWAWAGIGALALAALAFLAGYAAGRRP